MSRKRSSFVRPYSWPVAAGIRWSLVLVTGAAGAVLVAMAHTGNLS